MRTQVGAGSGQRYRNVPPPRAVAIARTGLRASAPRSVLQARLATLLAAQMFDFGTFTIMINRHGIGAEANPLIAHGFIAFGLPILAAGKAAQIVLVGSILVILGRVLASRPGIRRIATSVALLAVAGGMVGGVSNVLVQ
jgi:hypothetical protein